MKMLKKYILILILGGTASLLFFSCKDQSAKTSEEAGTEKPDTHQNVFCFRKEFPFKEDAGTKDILTMDLNIEGNKVTGHYDWLPAMKDKRVGTIAGIKTGDSIHGDYIFMQEGINDTVKISISLTQNHALISSEQPEVVFEADLPQVECK